MEEDTHVLIINSILIPRIKELIMMSIVDFRSMELEVDCESVKYLTVTPRWKTASQVSALPQWAMSVEGTWKQCLRKWPGHRAPTPPIHLKMQGKCSNNEEAQEINPYMKNRNVRCGETTPECSRKERSRQGSLGLTLQPGKH